MQMIDAQLKNFKGADNLLHYYISKDTFLMIGKLAGQNHRVLVSAQGDPEEIAKSDLITPIVEADLPEVGIGDPEWKTTWEIWIRKAEKYRQGHVFLCGESAHIHSVAGGQGWNVCMQDAYNLSWKLALVIQGKARDSLLETYAIEREPVSEQVIEGSSAIHEIILSHGSGLEDRMALTQTDGWNDNAVARISGLSYNYTNTIDLPDGVNTNTSPSIGERVPDVVVSSYVRLHQLFAHTRFTLLAILDRVDGLQLDGAIEAYQLIQNNFVGMIRMELIAPDIPQSWPGLLPIEDPEALVATALNAMPGGELILVRPDVYVGCRCKLESYSVLSEFLHSTLIQER
tara:strand:- start:186 stop:1217 length:1032 start_codon:yes stop_codon:yes gene_type:complete